MASADAEKSSETEGAEVNLSFIHILFGPQGTGGIYVRKGVEIRPLFAGGTGVQSYSRTQPKEMCIRDRLQTLKHIIPLQ